MTLESVKELLREIGFPESFTSDQTALTILALIDQKPRTGLLPGHSCLADGARIHDILEFVRSDFDRKVAENTRESYQASHSGRKAAQEEERRRGHPRPILRRAELHFGAGRPQ